MIAPLEALDTPMDGHEGLLGDVVGLDLGAQGRTEPPGRPEDEAWTQMLHELATVEFRTVQGLEHQ